VCAAPRGLAWDATQDALLIACATGELVTLPTAPAATPTRTVQVARDLRDVVLDGTNVWVTRFRSAQVLQLDAQGAVTNTITPPTFQAKLVRTGAMFGPAVAWRAVAAPGGGIIILHQRGQNDAVVINQPGGYGGNGDPMDPCDNSIVHAAITRLGGAQPDTMPAPELAGAVLAVDLAVSADGTHYAVAAPGNAHVPGMFQVLTYVPDQTGFGCQVSAPPALVDGEVTAVAFDRSGQLWAQSREPATLTLVGVGNPIALSATSRADTGHAIFHARAGGGLACASCHPEGGEDGRAWKFDPIGPRRTQSVRGGVLAIAPFHWDGDLPDLPALVKEVLVGRMSGPPLAADQLQAMSGWLDSIPYLPALPVDALAAQRGAALFNDPTGAGCVNCHHGAKLTDSAVVDVGTGGMFEVPSLRGVGWRDPFLHDGRAAKLADRFDPTLGGADHHGITSQLTAQEIADLVAFLESQ
jgi:hypothetical protein